MPCIEDLELIEPCGVGNTRPLLCMERALLTSVFPIGGGRHLKLVVEKFGQSYECVYFSHTLEELGLSAGEYVDIAFYPQINEFRARRSVQLLVNELRAHDVGESARVMGGDIRKCEETGAPSRADFAAVWRSLVRASGKISGSTERVMELLAPGMWDSRIALCLKIFEELGLLSIKQEGDMLFLCADGSKRVDLDDSAILSGLKQL